jgi:hypothetical protein
MRSKSCSTNNFSQFLNADVYKFSKTWYVNNKNCSAGLKKKSQYRMSWLVNLGVVVEEHRRIVEYTTRSLQQRISGTTARWIGPLTPRGA